MKTMKQTLVVSLLLLLLSACSLFEQDSKNINNEIMDTIDDSIKNEESIGSSNELQIKTLDKSEGIIEEEIISDDAPENIDEEKAIQLVRARMKELNDPRYYGNETSVRVDHLDDKENYAIQVFNNGQGQSETINWYTVDRKTGSLTSMFAENKN